LNAIRTHTIYKKSTRYYYINIAHTMQLKSFFWAFNFSSVSSVFFVHVIRSAKRSYFVHTSYRTFTLRKCLRQMTAVRIESKRYKCNF